MKTDYRMLLWSAAALALLLSVAVPGLNVIAVALLMVPYIVLYASLPLLAFIVHLAVIWAVATVVVGPSALIIGLFFLLPALVIGQLYRRRASARTVITAGTLAMLTLLLLELLTFDILFGFNLFDELSATIRANFEMLSRDGLLPPGWDPSMTESLIDSMVLSMPVALITVSFLYAVVSHWLARRALRATGTEVSAFRKAKDWMLPRSFVFYYLIVILLDLMMPEKDGSFMSVVVMNLLPLLRFAFTIQAIGFFFFLAAQKGWPRAVPLLLALPVLIFPPLSLIGVLDVAFPIRKSFMKP